MSDSCELTSYEELAHLVANIGIVIRETRRARQISIRGAAAQMGMSFSTLSRMENGDDFVSDNLTAVLRWLGPPAESRESSDEG